MSTREPLWYCHECHAEMRPLMVPDPVCASCHGSFVEKMENAADDPRQFAAANPGMLEGGMGDAALGPAALLLSLQTLMDRGMRDRGSGNATGPAITFEVRGPGGSRTLQFGRGANTMGNTGRDDSPRRNSDIPNMSTFLGANPFGIPPPGAGGDRPNISGPLMANYLMALLGHTEPGTFGMPENGRMGDYVFNQEALDQIISQIMENSNAHRPVPATDEIIAKLPREVLLEGSATLERDCAVCKEQFKLETEDPDEQIVVTLPCKHPFHQPCILPWLTSSGTCPVCRFALVPQPDQHPTPNQTPTVAPTSESRPAPPTPSQPPSNAEINNRGGLGNSGSGFIQSIFSNLMGLAHPQSHDNDEGSNNRNGSAGVSSGSTNSENSGQQGDQRGTSPPPRERPRSPQSTQQSPPSSPRWGTDYPVFRRSPIPPHHLSRDSRPAAPSSTPESRNGPGTLPSRNPPPSRQDSSHGNSRGPSAPLGSPGAAAERRRNEEINRNQGNSNNTNTNNNNNVPGSWSDELD